MCLRSVCGEEWTRGGHSARRLCILRAPAKHLACAAAHCYGMRCGCHARRSHYCLYLHAYLACLLHHLPHISNICLIPLYHSYFGHYTLSPIYRQHCLRNNSNACPCCRAVLPLPATVNLLPPVTAAHAAATCAYRCACLPADDRTAGVTGMVAYIAGPLLPPGLPSVISQPCHTSLHCWIVLCILET